MLLTRVLTAVVLLVVLLAVLYSKSFVLFVAVSAAFLAAAVWESARLFHAARPRFVAGAWTAVFLVFVTQIDAAAWSLLFALCAAIWIVRFVPALAIGLPHRDSVGNRLIHTLYSLGVLGCFAAIVILFQRSPAYLLSVLAIVWVADIGAYFSGKAFGRRKLAPSISPGKSWEGALGGWLLVVLLAAASIAYAPLHDTFAARLQAHFGWGGLLILLTLLVAASIVGDLFESLLKRRAGVKDSSRLLPGHGGVLDRVDALIPTLPLAVLAGLWL
jgi:phosphatidate cytidylyltransferase